MNLEKQQTILEMISKLKSGEKIFIECEKMELNKLCSELPNIEVQNDLFADGMHQIKKLKSNSISASKQIIEAMSSYKTGSISLPYPDAYVRQIVSKYNKVKGDNFKVKCMKGQAPAIYLELEDRKFITQSEFEEFETSMKSKLDLMQSCVIEIESDPIDLSPQNDLI